MANIRIKDLPSDGTPKQTDLIPIDLGSTRHATVKAVVESGRPTASKTEAELGVEASKAMTPLTTKQAIDAQVGASYVPKTVKINAGDGLTGGGELTGDVTVGLNTASTASLAKADSAVQTVNGKSGNSVALVKADVGLGNADNTSDINKPISTATQIALDGKYDNPAGTTSQYIRGDGSLNAFPAIPQGTVTSVGLTVPTGFSASGSPVTSSGTIAVSYATGYQGYTSAEASKLAGIAAGAQVNTVNSVNTKTGAVVLDAGDVGAAPDTVITDVNANTAARHTHSNKAILDATTASFLAAEKTKLSGIEVGAQVNTVTSVSGKTGAVTLVKADVGLGNVDNTSDASKPVSTATQTALNAKANSSVTVSAGSGLTGGGNLTSNRSIALNAASIASLGKADTALQAPGGTTGQILAKASADDNDVSWVTSEAATAVSYGPQTLTEAQKTQARTNIASVGYEAQTLTEPQKTQVRTNIDAATSAQGGKADTALQTLTAGSNITITGTGTSRTIAATVPPAPVTSVNSKTGDVVLNAGDVGALPATGTAADSAKLGNETAAQWDAKINNITPPTVDVMKIIADAPISSIGSYIFAGRYGSSGDIAPGGTIAGSSLRYKSARNAALGTGQASFISGTSGVTQGTYRNMGGTDNFDSNQGNVSIYKRIL